MVSESSTDWLHFRLYYLLFWHLLMFLDFENVKHIHRRMCYWNLTHALNQLPTPPDSSLTISRPSTSSMAHLSYPTICYSIINIFFLFLCIWFDFKYNYSIILVFLTHKLSITYLISLNRKYIYLYKLYNGKRSIKYN